MHDAASVPQDNQALNQREVCCGAESGLKANQCFGLHICLAGCTHQGQIVWLLQGSGSSHSPDQRFYMVDFCWKTGSSWDESAHKGDDVVLPGHGQVISIPEQLHSTGWSGKGEEKSCLVWVLPRV